MQKLTVLGSINADHVIQVPHFPQPGETLSGQNYHIVYGGKGANQAVAAARLGAKVDFIACIGEDKIGLEMKQAFQKDGINTDSIATIQGETTGIAMIQVADSGENSIVISAGANAHLTTDIVDKFKQKILDADALLMQLETPLDAIIYATKIAKQAGKHTVLNPAPAKALPDELLAQLTMITPNETEAEVLTGVKVVDEQSAAQAAAVFHQKGVAIVLITLGAKGVFISHNALQKIIPGFRVQAKDTTAAGDTFNGALVTALLEQKSLEEAIQFAHAAAAISVTRFGAQTSIPSRQETLDFLANIK
ncbi:ribokinase [Gallibacterium anatis]|uniref:ribokinase n=1 Tax=Gallibacterium anatis TaxID=750 RepID=UPI000530FC6D|nr:ribokinase [Gallibacterium anatis]KGQ43510.1 ribokinase [Gallibacterium anatis]KGQ49106.1 ribokinase [Gallibacterium anatis]KGQ60473.1 ribokinase [Gallibacterium anatis]KGQ67725.1 ribokinase [Gallibacterium anatis]OZN50291.1 ribokinase [Gallibacterium anatis]